MALKMHENSLFAVLLRSHWWVSALAAGGIFALIRVWFPAGYAFFAALPFAVIAGYVAWQQLKQPSAAKVAQGLERIRAMTAEEFAAALEAGFRREGFGVARLSGAAADFELSKGGRVALVLSRRWKASHTGVEPLKELEAARKRSKADDCVIVAAGELSAAALKYGGDNNFRIIAGAELVKLLR